MWLGCLEGQFERASDVPFQGGVRPKRRLELTGEGDCPALGRCVHMCASTSAAVWGSQCCGRRVGDGFYYASSRKPWLTKLCHSTDCSCQHHRTLIMTRTGSHCSVVFPATYSGSVIASQNPNNSKAPDLPRCCPTATSSPQILPKPFLKAPTDPQMLLGHSSLFPFRCLPIPLLLPITILNSCCSVKLKVRHTFVFWQALEVPALAGARWS